MSTTVTRLSVDCIIKGATPRAAMLPTTAPSRRILRGRMRSPDRLEHRKPTTQQALTPWEMTVAVAAPRTPIPKPKINSGSKAMFSTAPISTEHMATRACPWAVI